MASGSESQLSADLTDYIAALKRRRNLLIFTSAPIVALALALAIGLPDIYRSTALVAFSQAEVPGEIPAARRQPQQKSYADQYVNSLTEAVLTERNLERLLKEPDSPLSSPDQMKSMIRRIQQHTRVETVRTPVLDPDSGREREVVSAFTISYEDRDPEEAGKMAAWLSDAFLLESRRALQQRAANSAKFYDAEAERYREQITRYEAALAEFKAKNFGQLPELADVNLAVIDRTDRDLENTQMQIRALRQERILLMSQLEQARSQSPDANLLSQLEAEYAQKEAIYDPDHPDLLSLRRRIENLRRGGGSVETMSLPQQLEAQKAILSQARQRYSDDHPDVRRIQRKIESLEARIARGERADTTLPATPQVVQLRSQINGIDTQIAALEARSAELREKLDRLEKRVEMTPIVEREYKQLTRDLDLARAKYDELLKFRMDAELAEAAIAGGRSDELRLVQPAGIPSSPAKPARLAIVIIGLILALVVGLSAVLAAEGVDQT
ncbi:MAG TPA: GNVR domain-containing protein, partial [Steroidobacteraceae bacterium]